MIVIIIVMLQFLLLMGIFKKKKDSEEPNASVGPDEEVIRKISEMLSSLDELTEFSDKKY